MRSASSKLTALQKYSGYELDLLQKAELSKHCSELISKIKQYLADVKGRIAIAKSTQVIATEHHTYSNRARFFVDELEKMHGK